MYFIISLSLGLVYVKVQEQRCYYCINRGGFANYMVFIVIVIVTIIVMMSMSGALGRNVMRNTNRIEEGSEVVSVEPEIYGTKSGKHYEATVRFADGSWYRTIIGETDQHFMSYTSHYEDEHIAAAIKEAVEEHERIALKKAKRKRR